jgi:hypothetical protein
MDEALAQQFAREDDISVSFSDLARTKLDAEELLAFVEEYSEQLSGPDCAAVCNHLAKITDRQKMTVNSWSNTHVSPCTVDIAASTAAGNDHLRQSAADHTQRMQHPHLCTLLQVHCVLKCAH